MNTRGDRLSPELNWRRGVRSIGQTICITKSLVSLSLVAALAACGGDDGDSSTFSSTSGSSSSSGGPTSQIVAGTLLTPQCTSGSAQIAVFNLPDQYRTRCGVPVLQENTVLDQAAQNRAKYMGLNNAISSSEALGSTGFTGASYQDRAVAAGLPTSTPSTGANRGASIIANGFTTAQAGQTFINSLLTGMYHTAVIAYPSNTMGIGEYETQSTNSDLAWTNTWESISVLVSQSLVFSDTPLTPPCQGVTGMSYKSTSESSIPPNASSSGWGTSAIAMGNTSSTIILQSASMTDPSDGVTLRILNSTTGPSKALSAYQTVAYLTSPLLPNTWYSITLTGTVNGTAFSRNSTFTAGSVVG